MPTDLSYLPVSLALYILGPLCLFEVITPLIRYLIRRRVRRTLFIHPDGQHAWRPVLRCRRPFFGPCGAKFLRCRSLYCPHSTLRIATPPRYER